MRKLAGIAICIGAIFGRMIGSISTDTMQICISIGVALWAMGIDSDILNKK